MTTTLEAWNERLPAATISHEIEREIRRLSLAIADARGFQLYLATYNDRTLRDYSIRRLADAQQASGIVISVLDLSSVSSRFVLLEALHNHLGQVQDGDDARAAIMVTGLDLLLSDRPAVGTEALETANLQRDRFPLVCHAPVVFWLSPYATSLFARLAPDLWHWRAATFQIEGEAAPKTVPGVSEPSLDAFPEALTADEVRALEQEIQELSSAAADQSPRAKAYRARRLIALGDALYVRGEWDRALNLFRQAASIAEELGDDALRAHALGRVADILAARGQLDEALRIRREEELPVYERLGDVPSRAVTMGQIADILQARGQLDEALRTFREDVLPAFERLGDVRSRAVTMGKIADILQARGQLDEALRIRTDEQLPVYERLGDVRSRAVTMGKIADILQARGQLDEALRTFREDVLPAFERLGDVRSRAVTMGQIANILQARGQRDEALRIHLEERLPVAEAMQDADSIANVRYRCARIRLDRGGLQSGEAQIIFDELAESFAIYQQLGRADGIGHVGLLFAQVLAQAGHPQEALTVLDAAAAAFTTLQQAESVARVRALQQQIRLADPATAGG
ncbi:tetratricopeptide repeat protein [Defluviicoccus vanus]|uniref:Tetratricopeptide repeat protein n=1 Tax=Defluviicoccus vanus TaxID=111831 RepID=A0A7H1N5M9_9PROT|nr:tetratricopeptide repeat protein [Defluviicoccus vanus]QNT71015.1 tetratricopeptide repeat protein [Defluviicoccus vanus]